MAATVAAAALRVDDIVRVHPIGFSIPERYVVSGSGTPLLARSRVVATVIPGNARTYVFQEPSDERYHADYRASAFGITHRKGGHDCLRHYEVLAAGCVPLFPGIDSCPARTMTHFPKAVVAQALALVPAPPPTLGALPAPVVQTLEDLRQSMLEHTRRTLTTAAMARYLLGVVERATPRGSAVKRVLVLPGEDRPDYLALLTLHGLKEVLGRTGADAPLLELPYLYDDFPLSATGGLYGRGYSYARTLPSALKSERRPLADVAADLRGGAYDAVIYPSLHRGARLLEAEARAALPPGRVVYLCGEDHCSLLEEGALTRRGHTVFGRELWV